MLPIAGWKSVSARLVSIVLAAGGACTVAPCGCGTELDAPPVITPATTNSVRSATMLIRSLRAAAAQDWEQARDLAQAAIDDDDDNTTARLEYAANCWNLQDYDKAARMYERCFDSPVKGAFAKQWNAHCLAALGRWSEAQSAYNTGPAEAVPPLISPWCAPGQTAADTQDRAIVYWKKAVKDNPGTPVPLYQLANTYFAAGRADDARRTYDALLAMAPTWEPAIISAAFCASSTPGAGKTMALLDDVLNRRPDHVTARWTRAYARRSQGDFAGSSADFMALLKATDRRTPSEALQVGALVAWQSGKVDDGIAQLNALVAWGNTYSRLRLIESTVPAITALAAGKGPGSETSPLGRYAMACALLECIQSVSNDPSSIFLSMMNEEASVGKINTPTRADIEEFAMGPAKDAQDAARTFDMNGAMVANIRLQTLPHLGRCVRELTQALADRPDFLAAKVLLADVRETAGHTAEARRLLEEVLAADPGAVTVRLRLSNGCPLDHAQDLLEGVSATDAGRLQVMMRRIQIDGDAGDFKAASADALAVARIHGSFWDAYELLGIALQQTGQPEAAIECLEYSSDYGRTAPGMLARARLRMKLEKPEIAESLIDAWRAAPAGTAEETQALDLLRKQDTRSLVCGRCGGGGTISITSGSTGEYGSVSTTQNTCPQCNGLGLWHPKAR